MSSKVYFTKIITPESVLKMAKLVGVNLDGKLAIKLHSGEKGNQNFLKPEFFKTIIDAYNGTVVECNTAYDGARNTTHKHLELLKEHGWTENFNVDLLDAEGPDLVLKIPNGLVIKENYVGKNLSKYDSLLVLSHFKGHPCAGYGGALKQLAIGCASSAGKAYIHTGGFTSDQSICWDHMATNKIFTEAMADAASSVHNMFKNKVIYVNVMKNISVDCDCCAVAEDPCMKDIGILASDDPVAIDKACLDLIYAAKNDPGQKHFIERVEKMGGAHIIDASVKIGFGSDDYELINVD